ncbi:YqgE/AlgH family protein [Conexibacter sp. SYSU D00693]|uniref:YqgE/AlgH family protein n=1 Tax=Conexibacter sp. SYSU D00693 TaxID=2812560 RepID=UPI00196B9B14|nr:YqgE/AlgH family protein [Conexibacter sp. SYSU D00693]
MASLTGKLLVASPGLEDPNFARTVVAIANHDDDGALGLVLNRPSDTEVGDAVPELADLAEPGDVVHVGGPVQPQAIVLVAELEDPGDAAFLLAGRVGLVADTTDREALAGRSDRRRVFAGYAGWGPGQLEAELEREDWIVEDATPDDVLCEDPASLWSAVLERKGGSFRLVARMPVDPSLN